MRVLAGIVLLSASLSVAQAPGTASPGRGAHSSADEAAPIPGPESQPLLSPPASASVRLNGKRISVSYNSPAMRGRTIMGSVVPYGKVWRTGADPATNFVTAAPLKVGSLLVPAGSYTLYTLPAPPSQGGSGDPWLLILNQQIGQWGTVYDSSCDLGRVPMQAATLPSPQQSMTISFKKIGNNSVEMHIRWERVDEFVTITPAT